MMDGTRNLIFAAKKRSKKIGRDYFHIKIIWIAQH